MLKNLMKLKYYWHSFRYRYHGLLLDGCLCHDLRSQIKRKVDYHERKAVSLLVKM
ncbi:hypothetical protein [Neobacillus sp. D3-1R]|uniref:hypothetical protein n=1 Tax=Neobacillus sp. D3-1R TaxID=3445778 RepID=UPI003F9F7456